MGGDLVYILWWWWWFFLIGIVSIPLTFIIFKRFFDLGYGLSKTIGFLVIAYLVFVSGTLHLLPITDTAIYFTLLVYLGLNVYLFNQNKKTLLDHLSKNLKILIWQEILFTIGLLFWSFVRAHQPDINGLEKFMDFGFINSALRTKYLPPADIWFSGSTINYYWFGHYFTAIITKITQIPSYITYNLMIASIFGLTLTSAFSIASTLARQIKPKFEKRKVILAGLISAILLTLGGNFHTPIYVLKQGRDKYWYPDATRFIGYNPDVEDKTIHEFPHYSFVVSDLHAHLINLPFVLLYIALLLNYVTTKNTKKLSQVAQVSQVGKRLGKKSVLALISLIPEILTKLKMLNLLPLGFLLGVMFMTSAWDFGNYLLTTGFVVFLFNFQVYKFDLKTVVSTASQIIPIIVIAILTALPFIANFESVHTHSLLRQLAILWGFPIILTLIFSLTTLKLKLKSIQKNDLFIVALLISSWTLIVIPEIIYVKDIYIASHYRANTMFKLTYQAFVMFYLSAGYIAVRALKASKNLWKFIVTGVFAISFTLVLIYPYFAIKSYYGDLKTYKGLNGEIWVKETHPEVYSTIIWIRKNIKGQPVILEANGDSYTEFNLISAYTGLPTISGWFVHEWLWRGDSSFPQKRVTDIEIIYTSSDFNLTKSLLKKYKVEYVIIGELERQKYPTLNESKFSQLGSVAFSSGNTKVYRLTK